MFHDDHTPDDERRWIADNGPVCPDLIKAIGTRRDVDFFLLYSYRYYTAAMGAAAAPGRAVLVPTAEDDPAIRLPRLRRRVPVGARLPVSHAGRTAN